MRSMLPHPANLLLTLSSLLVLAHCGGSTVDLGQGTPGADRFDPPADIVSRPGPHTLWEGRFQVRQIVMDDTHVYMRGEADGPTGKADEIRSCAIADCEKSYTTLYRADRNTNLLGLEQLTVDRGELFWTTGSRIESCPVAGCPMGPRVVADDTRYGGWFVVDETFVYRAGQEGIVRGPRSGWTNETLEVIPFDSTALSATPEEYTLLSHEYPWFVADQWFYVSARRVSAKPDTIFRVPKQGGPFTALYRGEFAMDGFAIANDRLFITVSILAGSVLQCSLTACEAGQVALANTQPWPGDIVADADRIYWWNQGSKDVGGGSSSLMTCPLDTCAAPAPIQTGMHDLEEARLGHVNRIATNAQYVAWVHADGVLGINGIDTVRILAKGGL